MRAVRAHFLPLAFVRMVSSDMGGLPLSWRSYRNPGILNSEPAATGTGPTGLAHSFSPSCQVKHWASGEPRFSVGFHHLPGLCASVHSHVESSEMWLFRPISAPILCPVFASCSLSLPGQINGSSSKGSLSLLQMNHKGPVVTLQANLELENTRNACSVEV